MKNDNYDEMPYWRIPVTWEECGVIEIQSASLEEAMKEAIEDPTIELPDGHYVDASFDLSSDDIDYIRTCYNHGQADYIPDDNEAINASSPITGDDAPENFL